MLAAVVAAGGRRQTRYMPTIAPNIRRIERRDDAEMVPAALAGEPGLFVVDATWGTIAPMEVAPGVRTIGELELIEHLAHGLPLVDTRPSEAFELETIPGAVNLPSAETLARLDEVPDEPTVFFCNGPQCAATPRAIETMLEAGRPASLVRYYRGGLRDWMTLGFPVESGA